LLFAFLADLLAHEMAVHTMFQSAATCICTHQVSAHMRLLNSWWPATYSLGANWRWLLGWFLDGSLQCLNSAQELGCVGWIHL